MSVVEWGVLSHDIINDLFAAEMGELDLGDRYVVSRVLGQGGQGIVYLAQDAHVNREVAIKCAHDGNLKAEVELLSTMAHPGIPQIYDQGQATDGTHFMAMQYIEGLRLDHYLQQVNPSSEQRIILFREVCKAVHHAHEKGILHRDLKPSNIIVNSQAHITIIDWGLAATGDPRAVCGSPHFAAPEQLDGQPADKRADIFALGVLLYFIMSGELPYARRVTNFNEFRSVRAGLRRIPLNTICAHAPPYIEKISARAMSAQAGARYKDIKMLVQDIDDRQQRLRTRSRSKFTVVLVCMLLLIGVSFLLARNFLHDGKQQIDFSDEQSLDNKTGSQLRFEFVGPPAPKDFKWPDEDEQPIDPDKDLLLKKDIMAQPKKQSKKQPSIEDLPRLE
ncbi:MAG: serine/threonine protein kinase, partial [Planctomycetes bacterium]|nr:serine/threonine protein kinase [Planctomycetota bacterium]